MRSRLRSVSLLLELLDLPDAVLAKTRRVRIDMAPTLDSLNVAVASGIALYEATRSSQRASTR